MESKTISPPYFHNNLYACMTEGTQFFLERCQSTVLPQYQIPPQTHKAGCAA